MKRSLFSPIVFVSTILIFLAALPAQAKFWLEAEGGAVWQSKNDIQIPANSGTRFSLVDFGTGPAAAGRIYLGYQFAENHEVRALFAPLTLNLNGTFNRPIDFQNQTFAAQVDTEAKYRFNSYRVTYRHKFFSDESWVLKAGFTGKIRDAEIRLTQGAQTASRANVGFVPLLHFAAAYRLAETPWTFHIDMDALVAPQGRAEDIALMAGYQLPPDFEIRAGYRTIEGGADGGGGVYNFSWLHFAMLNIVWTP